MQGNKTYATAIVSIIAAIAMFFEIDITEQQQTALLMITVSLIGAFLRHGSKTDAAKQSGDIR